jgi:hypothetical protein
VADGLDDAELAAVRRLLDRQAVMECVLNSCRGIDRGDWALFRSAYHADAVEDHGVYVGDLDGLLEFLQLAMSNFSHFQRYLTNSDVDLDGDEAHVESYYLIRLSMPGATTVMVNGGRYLDRLERRGGRWGIVARVVTTEWSATLEGSGTAEASDTPPVFVPARMDKEDLSYQRPLKVTRSKRAN